MTTIALALVLWFSASDAQPQLFEKEAIDKAKATIVRSVDSTLPYQRLEAWLRDLFGSTTKTAWEVNDCGEQTGDPQRDRGRDFPMCVEVAVSLDSSRVLHLVFPVGSFKTGVRLQPPTFYYGCVVEAGVPVRWLKSLGEAMTVPRPPNRPL